MNRLCTALLGTTLLLAAPSAKADERLATRAYNPSDVVHIDGKLGVQATIAFDEEEHIENVAIGDSNSWQITPNKRANLLFVKPLAAKARTNMTVITDRHRYYFDLVAGGAGKPVYVLTFTYPDKPKDKTVPALAGALPLTGVEAQAIDAAAAQKPVDPAQLNFAWKRDGAARLLPARIYDDGAATYLSWAPGIALPAILVRNAKGDEGPVNYAVRDDVIVIDEVPALIVLRSGKASATLVNGGPPRKPETAAPAPASLAAMEN